MFVNFVELFKLSCFSVWSAFEPVGNFQKCYKKIVNIRAASESTFEKSNTCGVSNTRLYVQL